MSEVILVRPLSSPYRRIDSIPWGIWFIGSTLRYKGYSVKIIDQIAEADWKKTLNENLKQDTLLVGISAITGSQIKYGLEVAQHVKKLSPDIPVVWGGVHPTILPSQTTADNFVDVVVSGEGEITLLEVAGALKNNKGLKGIGGAWYKYDGKICSNEPREKLDLNELPDVSFDLIDIEKYVIEDSVLESERHFELHTSRGCPHGCSFCYNQIYNRPWRTLTVDRIMADLRRLKKQFKVDSITWMEDNFFYSQDRVTELAEKIAGAGLNITWNANCRIDYFLDYDSSFIGLIKRSGCRGFNFGAESGSDRILKLLNKNLTRQQIIDSARKLKDCGLKGYFQFMVGLPTEGQEDLFQTLGTIKKILEIMPDATFQGPSLYTPYPGTSLFDLCVEMGFKPPETLEAWSNYEWNDIHLPWIDRKYRENLKRIRAAIRPLNKFNPLINKYLRVKAGVLFKYKFALPCPELKVYDSLTKLRSGRG